MSFIHLLQVNECKYGILNLRAYYNPHSELLVIDGKTNVNKNKILKINQIFLILFNVIVNMIIKFRRVHSNLLN